mgnify:CR=1 FL=1
MEKTVRKRQNRINRHERIRKTVVGTSERPRLCIYRSLKNIYAQVIDDENGKTLLSCSTLLPEIREQISYGGNVAAAKLVGQQLGSKARENGIDKVVFDRGGFTYHGRVRALAESAREAGLKF